MKLFITDGTAARRRPDLNVDGEIFFFFYLKIVLFP